LQAAVDRANDAIRAYMQAHPHPDNWTPRQHERFNQLLAAWGAAVRAAREADEEPEPAAA
jgi:exonuclease V gamma subunit